MFFREDSCGTTLNLALPYQIIENEMQIIESKKTRAEMLIEQFNKTKNLSFLVNHDENFSYSGF